jgi:oligopeptide transport system substrate-binding protein
MKTPWHRIFCASLGLFAAIHSGCSKHAAPPTEKTLRISQRNEPGTLDPQLATLPDEFFIIRALGEGLLVPNPDGGAPLPGIASHYEVSSDGLTYTFHLRPDAKWSNGEPVTSAHFAAMLRRATAPGALTPKAHLFSAVRTTTTPDPRTLVITLHQPTADFPAIVASGPWIPTHPAAPLEQIANGPFTLADWKSHQHLTVRKNPRYHAAPDIPLDRIDFLAMDNGDTEERAFRAGQLDVTMAVPASKLASYRAAQPSPLHTVPLHEVRYLALNVTRPPLDDPRVRRALALALDRTALVEKVLLAGSPAFHFVPAGLGGYTPATRNDLYRQAEARLLDALPVIPLYFNAQTFLVSPQVHGWRADQLWTRFYRGLSLR